jgi:HSP20 family molecular chaperone IbpA
MTTYELTPKAKQEVSERELTRAGRTFVPDVDIAEDDQALYLWVDVPGVRKDKVSVDLHDEVLSIQGDVTFDEYEGLTPVYTEYNVGHFARRFTLRDASAYDHDHISARLADGVLEVRLPKGEKARPRRIPVATA